MLELLPIKHYSSFLLTKQDLLAAITSYHLDLRKFTNYEYKHLSLTRIEHDDSTLFNLHVGTNDRFQKLVIDVSKHGYRLYTMPEIEKGLFNNIRNNKSIFYINCPNLESVIETLYGEHISKRSLFRRLVDTIFQVDRVDTNDLVELNFSKYKHYIEIKHSFCVIENKDRPELFDIFVKELNFQTLVLIDATTYICLNSMDRTWYLINIRHKKNINREVTYIYNIYRIKDNNDNIFNYDKQLHDNLLKKLKSSSSLEEKVSYLQNNILLEVTPSKISYRTY